MLTANLYSQVTEKEDLLKSKTTDSIPGWKRGGVVALNFSHTSLTNWAAGGQSSYAYNGLMSFFLNYKKEKNAWDNSIDLGYGMLNQENALAKKTDDRIDIVSKYGREAKSRLYYALLLNFKTQMTEGYNYPNDTTKVKISNRLAPAYIVGALGLDYKPGQYTSIFAAPLTSKITIVNDQALANARAFGVDSSKNMKSEFGGYLRVIYSKNDFQMDFLENLSFTTKIDLFSNYINNPENVVVNWETLIALKINKYISMNVNTQLIYDDKIKIGKDSNGDAKIDDFEKKPRIQLRENIGVGFAYKF
jgi:hypothetical protein